MTHQNPYPPDSELAEIWQLGYDESDGDVGVTYDDDPTSERSEAYDMGRTAGEKARAGTKRYTVFGYIEVPEGEDPFAYMLEHPDLIELGAPQAEVAELEEPEGLTVQLVNLPDESPIRDRWTEVINHGIKIEYSKLDPVDDGYVTLYLDREDADKWGIYEVLSISPSGTIAEYNVNQPSSYGRLSDLIQAAAVRTAAT